jgi:hypothetical protein
MTQTYIRTAEAVGEAIGDVFPELPKCLLAGPNRLANRPDELQVIGTIVEAPGIEERRNRIKQGNPPLSAENGEADDPEKHPGSSPDAANSAAHQHGSNERHEDDELALFNVALAEHAERADVAALLRSGLTVEPRSKLTERTASSPMPVS